MTVDLRYEAVMIAQAHLVIARNITNSLSVTADLRSSQLLEAQTHTSIANSYMSLAELLPE